MNPGTRPKTTKPAGVPIDNSLAVLYAIACNDASWPRDPAVYARNVPVEPPVKLTGNGPRNVLILQNLRDPATSWRSGFGLRTALGRQAAFVTQDAGGHGIYGVRSGPCTRRVTGLPVVAGGARQPGAVPLEPSRPIPSA